MHLRNASWEEVVQLFQGKWHYAVQNANGWAGRYGELIRDWPNCPVELVAWTDRQLYTAMEEMSRYEPRMTVDMRDGENNAILPPRIDGLPAVVVEFPNGKFGMIDGKHRANKWKHVTGSYAILLIRS